MGINGDVVRIARCGRARDEGVLANVDFAASARGFPSASRSSAGRSGACRQQELRCPAHKIRVARKCHFGLLEDALQLPIERKRGRIPTTVGLEPVVKNVDAEQIFDHQMALATALQFTCAKDVRVQRHASPARA